MAEKQSDALFDAFREDHAVLGRGFHEISTRLRAGDIEGARGIAERLDTEAGPHIVFEEEHFYPALKAMLAPDEVERMYAEHRLGLDVVQTLAAVAPGGSLADKERADLLEKSEAMEGHIAECGTLFGAMGGISSEERKELLEALLRLRREGPHWSRYAEKKDTAGGPQ